MQITLMKNFRNTERLKMLGIFDEVKQTNTKEVTNENRIFSKFASLQAQLDEKIDRSNFALNLTTTVSSMFESSRQSRRVRQFCSGQCRDT